MRRRNNLEIDADILRIAKDGARKTWIVYGANLNFNIIKGYLKGLLQAGRLRQAGPFYYTTEKGQDLISHVEAITSRGG